jgi:DNA-directed RNA polymerase specialized sigma24 family protein
VLWSGALLECTVGTVKSQAAHGLGKLRRLLEDHVTIRAEETV